MRVNYPPRIKQLTVFPEIGKSLQTIFNISIEIDETE